MKTIAVILGIMSTIGMFLAFIPLFGWLNWLNIPFAILGLIFSLLGNSPEGKILCILAIVFGLLRLILGGGIF